MQIYKHATILALEEFYGSLLIPSADFDSIQDHLEAIAIRMLEGVQAGVPCVFKEINNYHSDYLSQSQASIEKANFTLVDCKATIAQEYGFANWDEVLELCKQPYDLHFEQAVSFLLKGEYEKLEALLIEFPDLVHRRSQYGHGATLLHYVGSNGVELWRQKVPQNLATLCELLLTKGSDPKATMKVYGGNFDTLSLLMSSAPPKAAGVQEAVASILHRVMNG